MAETHTSVLERTDTAPVVAPTDDGDHDRFSHYISHRDRERAVFDNIPATALCGKKWLPSRDPKKYPVCPECKAAYEGLPPGDDQP